MNLELTFSKKRKGCLDVYCKNCDSFDFIKQYDNPEIDEIEHYCSKCNQPERLKRSDAEMRSESPNSMET